MKLLTLITCFTCLSLLAFHTAKAQGCSDAGLCTMPGTQSHHEDTVQHAHLLSIGAATGQADNNITATTIHLEYAYKINQYHTIATKVSAINQNGNNISLSGLSDLIFNYQYRTSQRHQFIFGIKVPANNANRTRQNAPLPMDYQSSLGTFDLLLSYIYNYRNLELTLGFQQPLTQNKNSYLAINQIQFNQIVAFNSTNQFNRAADLLLRMAWRQSLTTKWSITPSLLPIYHIANDTYLNLDKNRETINGSKGLTLNANIQLGFQPSNKIRLQAFIAAPLTVRQARPDGLTRSTVAGINAGFAF